jgi:hypothetical protein
MRWAGIVSILLLAFVWLALDDITTDNATGPYAFEAEYSVLVSSGAWFVAVAIWLFIRRRALAGIVSLAAIALAVAAFRSLPHYHAPASALNYMGLFSLAWFLGLAVWMIARRESPVKTAN